MRQTNKKTLATSGAIPNSGFTIVNNPPKLIQTANNFSSDVGKQLLIANDRNRDGILGYQFNKRLKKFAPCYSQSHGGF
jgi:hypothetical protein